MNRFGWEDKPHGFDQTGFLSKRRGLMWFFRRGDDKIDTIWMSHGYLVRRRNYLNRLKNHVYIQKTLISK